MPLVALKKRTPRKEGDGSLLSLELRNALRTQRTHAYLRRRLMNGLTLLVAELAAWAGVALLVNALVPGLGGAPLPWDQVGLLMGTYTLLTGFTRLQPGWGLGIVNELRALSMSTALLVLVLTVNLGLSSHGVNALLPGTLLMLVGLPALLLTRSLVKSTLLRAGKWGVPVVVYGAGLTGERVIRALQAEAGLGYQPLALYDDDPARQSSQVAGVTVLGTTQEWTQEAPVAIVAMPGASRTRLVELLDGPLTVYRAVILIPDLFDVQSLWVQAQDLGGILGLRVSHNLADPLSRGAKRGLELLVTLLALPFWLPLCAMLAGLIWLEDRHSPVFFQKRVGLGGHEFQTWKFRTMLPDAEAVLQRRLAEDAALRAEWQANFKLRKDPRITRVGSFLRKTSLDELPQLINVLRGEMALVGPRPLPSYHLQELPSQVQQLRLQVRPGMTGLWQVSGRSDAGNEGMIRLDPYYVRNWSIWLDAVILLRTFRAVLQSAGAY